MPGATKPADDGELIELVRWAASAETPLELVGGGSKRNLGRPLGNAHTIDMTDFSGITLYEPDELVLSARANTKLADIEAALEAENQYLAFEPGHLGAALSPEPDDAPVPTLGGVVATGLSGPRRIQAGAVRDHVLGIASVTGRAEAVKTGGRVVKNVTGYDLSKLLTGSFGTLAAMTDITLKVLPAPEKARTVLIFGLSDTAASAAMTSALMSPHGITGAAHLPQRAAERSHIGYVKSAATGATAIRVEGFGPSVEARCAALKDSLGKFGPIEQLRTKNTRLLWNEIRDLALIREPQKNLLWRISLAPRSGAAFVDAALGRFDGHAVYDWGGGLVWLSLDPSGLDGESSAAALRALIAQHGGGHATLIRAPASMRAAVPVFEPQDPALAALTRRVKESFDPTGIFGPGRMYDGV
ncbi:MAG: glycolate oxidase subunit GlcE [Alphaproteobacteria bacterium]|nr:glycolate oxidase subunit GlcE [Alphaproteobacteria bacterium]